MGAGLGRDSGKSSKLLDPLVRVMKGVFTVPDINSSWNLVSQIVFSIFNSSTIIWFIWGSLLFFAICVTCAPFLDSWRSVEDRDIYLMLDEFRRESRGILKEMRRL